MPLRHLSGLSLRDLEYASTIGQSGSFVRAAEICGVSQPALSQQIKKLEHLLGVQIFERQGRQVLPTEAGTLILQKADEILARARGLFEIGANLANPLMGDVHLGVIPTIGPYFMPRALPALRRGFPDLRLHPYEDTTDNLMALLKNRKLDIALIAAPSEQADIASATLCFEPFVLACPVGHKLACDAPVAARDLDGLDLLMLSREHCLRDQTLALCNLQAKDGGRVASSLEMLRQMVAVGEGCALLPALAVSDMRAMEALIKIRSVADTGFGRHLTLVWRSSDPRGSYFRKLAESLLKHLSNDHKTPVP
jgi:LysR family hydrogen peroxide-inducible transcriptional activator